MISRRGFINKSGTFLVGLGLADSLLGNDSLAGGSSNPTQQIIRGFEEHPEIYFEGQKISRMFGRAALPGRYARYKIEQYRSAGIKTYFTELEMANVIGWDGADDYDYSLLDGHINKIVKAHPDIRLLLYVGCPGETPYLWNKMHEDQLAQLQNGDKLMFASLGSEIWRKDSAEAMRRLAEHFENSEFDKNIMGYNAIWMANEWFGFTWHAKKPSDPNDDFSEPMRQYFRQFLRQKYQNNEDLLRRNWKNPKITFGDAELPTLEERYQVGNDTVFSFNEKIGTKVTDYYQAASESNADLAIAWGKGLRAGMIKNKLIGLMQGATHHGGSGVYQNRKQGALKKLLNADVFDFHHTPPCYADTENIHQSMMAIDTIRLHKKIAFNQIDAKTFISPNNEMAMKTSGGVHPGYIAKDLEESLNLMKRDCSYALAKNVFCYWLEGGPGTMFPINSHGIEGAGVWSKLWYDQPELKEMISKLKKVFDENQKAGTKSVSEIALLSSNRSMYYRVADPTLPAIYHESLRNLILTRCGVPFDDLLLEDFPLIEKKYKFYIFNIPFYIESKLRKIIIEKLNRENATALWLYAPGIVDEKGANLSNLEELTGMKMGRTDGKEFVEIELSDNIQSFFPDYSGNKCFGTESGPVKYDKRVWRTWPSQNDSDFERNKKLENFKFKPVFYADDPEAEKMGLLKYFNKAGLAYKNTGKRKSFFCAAPVNNVSLLQSMLKFAGVHIYNIKHDLIYANSGYLTVFALDGEGKRTLRFLKRITVTDSMTNKTIVRNSNTCSFFMKSRETIILKYE